MTDAAVFIMFTAGTGCVAQDSCTGMILATAPDIDTCAAEAFRAAPTCNTIAVLDGAGRATRTIHRNAFRTSANEQH